MQSKARLYSGSESVRDLASEPMRVTSSANGLTLGQVYQGIVSSTTLS